MAEIIDVPISDQIRERIKASEKSFREVAKETGIPHPTISRFMRGERGLSMEAIDKLCVYFRISLTDEPAKPARKKRKAT